MAAKKKLKPKSKLLKKTKLKGDVNTAGNKFKQKKNTKDS